MAGPIDAPPIWAPKFWRGIDSLFTGSVDFSTRFGHGGFTLVEQDPFISGYDLLGPIRFKQTNIFIGLWFVVSGLNLGLLFISPFN